MNATPTSKSAASSTPAAPPPASPPADSPPKTAPKAAPVQDADAEDYSQLDIAGALSQLSEDSQPAAKTAPANAPDNDEPDTAPTDGEASESAAEAGEEAAGESVEKPAAGDATGDATGAVDNTSPEPEAPAAPTADTKKPSSPAEQRIHELTARSKSAEEELAKTRERLASFEAEASSRLDSGVLDHVDTLDALAKQRAATVKLHQWALAHPQGGEMPDGKGGVKTYDDEGVRQIMADTFGLLNEAIPAREQYLRSRTDFDAAAVTAYPWLKDTRAGAGAQVQALIEAMPAVRKLGPNYRIVAADAYVGQQLRDAGIRVDAALIEKLKGGKAGDRKGPVAAAVSSPTGTARRTPPPAPAPAGVVPGRVRAGEASGHSASKRLSKGDGNVNDLTASIAAKFG